MDKIKAYPAFFNIKKLHKKTPARLPMPIMTYQTYYCFYAKPVFGFIFAKWLLIMLTISEGV